MNDCAAIFLKGFVLGFSIAAPVGPIGLLCINRTLTQGWIAGAGCGLGTAVADAADASVAAFGLTVVATALTAADLPLRIVGAIGLAWLGRNTWKQKPASGDAKVKADSSAVLFGQTFVLTLTNPATILSFAAIFAGLGLAASATPERAATLVTGTFMGSMAWWLVLSGGVNLLRHKVTPTVLMWINRGAGAVLIAFAVWLAWGLLRQLG